MASKKCPGLYFVGEALALGLPFQPETGGGRYWMAGRRDLPRVRRCGPRLQLPVGLGVWTLGR